MNPWEKYQSTDVVATPNPAPTATVNNDGPWSKYSGGDTTVKPTGKPFYDALGANMTPEMKAAHPNLAGIEQTAQDVGTVAEKAANGLTLGGLDYGLKKANIQPPNFDNTAPENKSGLNMAGDAANMASGTKTLGVIGSKVVAPAAKAVAKAVPEGLKNSSYALMQSIVNQLPKEFKYGANAGRAMVKEGFSGDAASIKEQADQRLDEIKVQGDALASASNKPVNNSNAIKVIDDKIAELQSKSPRSSASTITKLQNAKDDLLQVREGDVLDPATGEKTHMRSQDISPENMTPKETLDLKRNFDDQTAWKGTASDDTVFNKTMQQARTQLKDNLNDAAPGMKEWNQRYADLRAAQQAAGRTATRDQAGVGISNVINNFVRGSVGMSTFGAMITGHGELAGEILAGGIGKEIITNPYLKSKLAQGLYGLSEADKMAIFKAAPWLRKAVSDTIDNFRQKPTPRGEPVDAELVDNRPKGIGVDKPMTRNDRMIGGVGNSDGSVVNQPGYVPPGLPNNAVGRTGVNPNTSMGGLPDPGNSAIRQPGYVPKGLPEPFQGRSGVDRPWENKGLPNPRQAGQSSGPVIKQGTSYVKPPADKAYPQTDFGHQIKNQMMNDNEVALHPAEQGRADLERLYPSAKKGNPNIAESDLEDFNNMKDWELSQNKGGWDISGGHQTDGERVVTKSDSGHSDAFKKVSGNSENKGFDLLRKASSGEEMTPGEKLKIKMMTEDFRKNIKPLLGTAAIAGTATALGSNNANASTIGQKNNNPINLKAFDKWEGMSGQDKYGHAQFPDLDHGIRAGLKNLNTHQRNNPNESLNNYLNTFAEKNGSSEAKYIADKLGVSPNTKLKDLNMGRVLIHLARIESKTVLTPKDIIRVKMRYKIR